MNGLAYFPWIALAGACLTAVTFLVMWSIAEMRLDREADTVHYLTSALEECEHELVQERAALDRIAAALNDENDKLVRELAAAKREVNRLQHNTVVVTDNAIAGKR